MPLSERLIIKTGVLKFDLKEQKMFSKIHNVDVDGQNVSQ